jgi:hypothetical protein
MFAYDSAAKLPHNATEFRGDKTVWVWAKATLEKCGVETQTAYLWAKAGKIDFAKFFPVEGNRRSNGTMAPGQAARRAFYIKKQIEDERKRRQQANRFPRSGKVLAADCFLFMRGKLTLIAAEKTHEECGVIYPTVALWAGSGWISKGEWMKVAGGKPPRRLFFIKEEIDAVQARRAIAPKERQKLRSTTEIKSLHDDDFISVPEAAQFGISEAYICKYWDAAHAKRTKGRKPCPAIGRIIKTKMGEKISGRGHIVPAPMIRWGDVRQIIEVRDNPAVPTGGVLMRDALPLLKNENIEVGETKLVDLLRAKIVGGGKIDGFKRRNLQPIKLWWMKWDDRYKIRQYQQPGGRVFWIDGKDFYPVEREAAELAGFKNASPLRRRIRAGSLESYPHDAPSRNGDSMAVCLGDDLRDIAEAVTGFRPKPPTKPRKQATPQHAETIIAHIDKRHGEQMGQHAETRAKVIEKIDASRPKPKEKPASRVLTDEEVEAIAKHIGATKANEYRKPIFFANYHSNLPKLAAKFQIKTQPNPENPKAWKLYHVGDMIRAIPHLFPMPSITLASRA